MRHLMYLKYDNVHIIGILWNGKKETNQLQRQPHRMSGQQHDILQY